MVDGGKFISGAMAALSVMVNLEVPHVNVLSKVTNLDHHLSIKIDKLQRNSDYFMHIKLYYLLESKAC